MKAGRDALGLGRPGKHVARNLLDGELVERQIRVDGVDDPIPKQPDRTAAVFLVAIGVRVTGQVEPTPSPPFAIVRGMTGADPPIARKPPVSIPDKFVRFLWSRRNAVKSDTTGARACSVGWGEG